MTTRTPIWGWLGRPLALDFANTIARAGNDDVELLDGVWALEEWARREHPRVPRLPPFVPSAPNEGVRRMAEVRALRDAIRASLDAAAEGGDPPARVRAQIVAATASDGSPLGDLLSRVAVSQGCRGG
jgi:hypothetical protein